MSTNEQTPNGTEQDELSSDALESVSGGIIGDCTGGGLGGPKPITPFPLYPGYPGGDKDPYQPTR